MQIHAMHSFTCLPFKKKFYHDDFSSKTVQNKQQVVVMDLL